MITLPTWFWKAVAGLAVLAGACGATWFMADAHYSKQYVALKSQYEQATKDQAAENAATLTQYAQAALGVQDEAKSELADMDATIDDLRVRLSTASGPAIKVSRSASSAGTHAVANGSATAASSGSSAAATGSATACLDVDTERLALTVGKDALSAEILWRKFARGTGQIP